MSFLHFYVLFFPFLFLCFRAEYEYQLTVCPDLFTNKHTQWYYFQVTNTQAGIDYRFTIIHFTKPASLYNRGMHPLFYSENEASAHNIGWQRIGDQMKYYRSNQGQDGCHYFSYMDISISTQ